VRALELPPPLLEEFIIIHSFRDLDVSLVFFDISSVSRTYNNFSHP